jgi:purine-binding chemotaxis protein CheW
LKINLSVVVLLINNRSTATETAERSYGSARPGLFRVRSPHTETLSRSREKQMVSETSAVGGGVAPSQGNADCLHEVGRTPFLLCRAGSNFCALPLDRVAEIMRALPIEPVAGAPRYVCGLSIIRRTPAPIVDIGLLLGGQPTRAGRLIAIRVGSRTVALAVDAVIGIRTIVTAGELPPLLREASEAIAAIGTLDAALLFFLRTARIVPEDLLLHFHADGAAA